MVRRQFEAIAEFPSWKTNESLNCEVARRPLSQRKCRSRFFQRSPGPQPQPLPLFDCSGSAVLGSTGNWTAGAAGGSAFATLGRLCRRTALAATAVASSAGALGRTGVRGTSAEAFELVVLGARARPGLGGTFFPALDAAPTESMAGTSCERSAVTPGFALAPNTLATVRLASGPALEPVVKAMNIRSACWRAPDGEAGAAAMAAWTTTGG